MIKSGKNGEWGRNSLRLLVVISVVGVSPEASSLKPPPDAGSAALEGGRGRGDSNLRRILLVLPPARPPFHPPRRRPRHQIRAVGGGERPWEEMKLFFTMARQHVRSESGGRVGREDMELMEMPRTISISSSATAPVAVGRRDD